MTDIYKSAAMNALTAKEQLAFKLGSIVQEMVQGVLEQMRAEERAADPRPPDTKPDQQSSRRAALPTKERLAFTIPEAAEACGVSVRGIWRRIKDGDLSTFTWAGRTLIRADVLQAAIDRASGLSAERPKMTAETADL
jgi:hypothetical protein